MSIAKEIESLVNDIGGGLTESAIRSRLLTIQERAEALDADLKRYETALEECNSALHNACADLERLKADAQTVKLKPKPDLADDTIKVLRLFFDRDLSVSQVARALGISEGMSDYHCGVLQERSFIALPMMIPLGVEPQLYITQKGREYIVRNGLV